MLIRRETVDDRAAVVSLQDRAFATDDAAPAPEARLVEALHAAGDVVDGLSLVAEGTDGTVVGHVLGSRATLGGRPSLGLGPLGVLPEWQRRGVGSALVHAFLGAADALGHPATVLLGDPGYYHRFGFVLAAPLGIMPPDPAWTPYFQVRRLGTWTGREAGDFRYAEPFDLV